MKITTAPSPEEFINSHRDFLGYLASFRENCPTLNLSDIIAKAGGPEHVAIVSVDLVKGFCSEGAISSERVGQIVPEAVRIITAAAQDGVQNFIFTCDSHPADSKAFQVWPPHCVQGTRECELEDALFQLPQASQYVLVNKPSINSFLATDLAERLERLQPKVLIAMGDVTDLCYYQLATNLKMLANAHGWDCRVIAPLSAVETYDTPMQLAQELNIPPHDGDFINAFFAYHLYATGVEVVKDLV